MSVFLIIWSLLAIAAGIYAMFKGVTTPDYGLSYAGGICIGYGVITIQREWELR